MRWVIWILATSFYFYEYVVRVAPSVIVGDLMREFQIDAADVGRIGAFYFYAYALMQVPVGILLDRFGTRCLLTTATIVCSLSTILFGMSSSVAMAEWCRLFMGLASAFGFVGMIYTTAQWFDKKRIAYLIGAGNSLGMLGAVAGEGPFGYLVESVGWRWAFEIVGFFGILLAILIYAVYRTGPEEVHHKKGQTLQGLLSGLKQIVVSRSMWLLAVIASLCYATTPVFGGLWGASFLKNIYKFNLQQAGYAESMIFLGTIIGGPTIGHLCREFHHKKIFLQICSILALICFLPVLYLTLPPTLVFAFIFGVGLFSAAQLITYSLAIESNPARAKATAVAYINCIVFIASSLLQPFIGYLLDSFWGGEIVDKVAVYQPIDYRLALSVLPITFIGAFILSFFIKNNKVRG